MLGVESAVQVLQEADAVHTIGHREVRVEVTAVQTVDGHEVTVAVGEAIQCQDDDTLTWRVKLSVRKIQGLQLGSFATDTSRHRHWDRIHVHEPSTWFLANANLLMSCDKKEERKRRGSSNPVLHDHGVGNDDNAWPECGAGDQMNQRNFYLWLPMGLWAKSRPIWSSTRRR